METSPPAPHFIEKSRPAWQPLAALLLLAIPAFYFGLGAGEPVVNAEERCLEIAQTMLQTGDMLVPRIDGHPHLTKPPLYHWATFLVSRLRGRADLVSLRLVSALAATVTVCLVYLLARFWYGGSAAWWSGLVMVSIQGLMEHAHRGMFDAALTAFVCLAILGYALVRQGERRGLGYAALVLGLAGGFLVKGPYAWIVPLLPMIVDGCWRRRERRWRWGIMAAVAAGVLALSLPWYGYLLARVPEARRILADAVMVNFGHKSDVYDMAYHSRPFYYYLGGIAQVVVPWTLVLIPVAITLWRRRRQVAGTHDGFLVVWLVGNMLILSLIPAKATRYLLPLTPAFAVLAGGWLASLSEVGADGTRRRWLHRLSHLHNGLLAAGAIGLPIWLWVRPGIDPILCVAAGLACLFIAGGGWWLLRRQRWPAAIMAPAAAIIILSPPLYASWMPRHRYIHEHRGSPEAQQYHEREARLKALVTQTPGMAREDRTWRQTP